MVLRNSYIEYDLIIDFKEDKYVDIQKIKEFRIIGDWHKYSSHGFRGFCKLSKEELAIFIQKN